MKFKECSTLNMIIIFVKTSSDSTENKNNNNMRVKDRKKHC